MNRPASLWLSLAFVAAVFAALPGSANASVIFNIVRTSDTHGDISGTGTLSALCFDQCHILSFVDPYGVEPLGYTNFSVMGGGSTLAMDSYVLNFAAVAGPSYNFNGPEPVLYLGYVLASLAGTSPSGVMPIDLSGGLTFAPIGSSGDVYFGTGTDESSVAGTWNIVDTPEPGTFILLGAALGGFIAARRRR